MHQKRIFNDYIKLKIWLLIFECSAKCKTKFIIRTFEYHLLSRVVLRRVTGVKLFQRQHSRGMFPGARIQLLLTHHHICPNCFLQKNKMIIISAIKASRNSKIISQELDGDKISQLSLPATYVNCIMHCLQVKSNGSFA